MSARYDVIWTDDGLENHLLVDHGAKARAAIAPGRGGMVTRFRVGDENVLYLDEQTLHDPSKNVRGGIPVLFPIAGRLPNDAWRLGDQAFAMKQHGFARDLPWTVVDQSAADGASVALELRDSDVTRLAFPFRFRLIVTYTLRDGALTVTQRASNLDTRPMPIHPGFHPYFGVSDARKGDASILVDAKTAYDNRTRGLVALNEPIDLTGQEVDLHILDAKGAEVTLVRPPAAPIRLTMDPSYRVVVVWTLAGRDFVCVEPWTAPAGALDLPSEAADRRELVVAPGATHESTFQIAVAT